MALHYWPLMRNPKELREEALSRGDRYREVKFNQSNDSPKKGGNLKVKEPWMVEQNFRLMKAILETRPVFHRTDELIRGHIFCSFLSLLLIKEIKNRLEQIKMPYEWEDILQDLDALEEIELEQKTIYIPVKNKRMLQ